MSPDWGDLNARARGLGTRLVSDATLEQLAAAPDLAELRRAGAATGALPGAPEAATVPAMELAVRRGTTQHLRILLRWIGPRLDLLRCVIEAEDCRSLRALLRGAAHGVSADTRLTGLTPTPNLPERVLQELARQPRCRDIVALLVLWHNPYAAPLQAAVATDPPDLFRLEIALNRTFAERATGGAADGGAELRRWVEELIDQMNLRSGLVLAADEVEAPVDLVFLPGGRCLTQDRFSAAVATREPGKAAQLLAAAFDPDPIADAVRQWATDPAALERALTRLRLDRLADAARRNPLGPAPLLFYLARLQLQTVNLHHLIWSAALGMPTEQRRLGLTKAA